METNDVSESAIIRILNSCLMLDYVHVINFLLRIIILIINALLVDVESYSFSLTAEFCKHGIW